MAAVELIVKQNNYSLSLRKRSHVIITLGFTSAILLCGNENIDRLLNIFLCVAVFLLQ